MFLTPEVLINLIVDFLILIFMIHSFFIALKIVLKFDFTKDTPLQYSLLKSSYLVSVIVKYAIFFKMILIFYFVFTIDKISVLLPGAMCGAGVITANEYGVYLLVLKVINIYLLGFWLLINKEDMNTKDYRFTKKKFKIFLGLFLLLVLEFVLEWLYFKGIDPAKVVSCCGVIFSATKKSAISYFLSLPRDVVVLLFYATFIFMIGSFLFKRDRLFAFFNFLFLFITILAIIVFFSPYIYELPRHRCPFCLLQKEYFFVGYFIYTALFLGTFFGIWQGLVKVILDKEVNFYKRSLFFDGVVLAICSFYPIQYFVKNATWLF